MGQFEFKAIKTGKYVLAPEGHKFWYAKYNVKTMAKYGAEYIVFGSIFYESEDDIEEKMTATDAFEKVVNVDVEQPLVYIPFDVRTAGGYSK